MSKRELDQADLLAKCQSGSLTLKKAAEYSGLSYRQMKRKYKIYKYAGTAGIKHKARGKPSNRKTDQETASTILALAKTTYRGYGPTLLAEKLFENHQIRIDHETVRRIVIGDGLFIPRKRRSDHRSWRDPKHHAGEMVQVDGSEHIWFGSDYSTLILFIDDATKEMYAQFQPESTKGVATAFRGFINKYGIPRKLYSDKGSVYKINSGNNKQAKTQFERMCNELGCEIAKANSPQAKGRVERAFKTLQDRLEKELKERNITNIEAANQMIEAFIDKLNAKFRIKARNNETLYKSTSSYDLDSILCYKYQRKLNNDYTITFKNRWFQIVKKQSVLLHPGDVIEIRQTFDGTVSLWRKEVKLSCFETSKRVKPDKNILVEEYKLDRRVNGQKPKKNHPWRDNKYEIEKRIAKGDISKEFKR